MEKERWFTYDEWRRMGYQVQRGEKATWMGPYPKFSSAQVKMRTNSYYDYVGDGYENADPDDPFEEMARDAAWGLD